MTTKVALLGPANSIHLQRWANALAQRGHRVFVASQHPCDPGLLDPAVEFKWLRYRGERRLLPQRCGPSPNACEVARRAVECPLCQRLWHDSGPERIRSDAAVRLGKRRVRLSLREPPQGGPAALEPAPRHGDRIHQPCDGTPGTAAHARSQLDRCNAIWRRHKAIRSSAGPCVRKDSSRSVL